MTDTIVGGDAPSENRADDGRTFADLSAARHAVWRGVTLQTLREVRELQKRLHEAAIVIKANDPTRLSSEAVRARFEPGPHRDPA